ncbi:hypothetical protein KAR91_09720 [Candidatus Pacearchaeota archaeon]|nr:hypothetical protein [Candidatus Pacearchaeota archaeon]
MKTVFEAIRAKRIGHISVRLTPEHFNRTGNVLLHIESQVNGKKFYSERLYQLPELESWWDVLFSEIGDEMKKAVLEADL